MLVPSEAIVEEPSPGSGRCLVCGDLVSRAGVSCPDCGSPYHRDCWTWNHGCGIYGCSRTPPPPPLALLTKADFAELTDLVAVADRTRIRVHGPKALLLHRAGALLEMPYAFVPWRLLQALVVGVSYVVMGGALAVASLPLALVAFMQYLK